MNQYYFHQNFWKVIYKNEQFKSIISCFIILAVIKISLFCSPALAKEFLNIKNVTIIYDSPVELQEMNRKLNIRLSDNLPQQNFNLLCSTRNFDILLLGAKIDTLLLKVADLLKLNLQTSSRLSIRIYKDGRQVARLFSFFQSSSQRTLFGYGSMEAFYEPSSQTILISLRDLHEGILAHEMAHFLLCTCATAPPPEYMQEEMAQYVESRIY